MHAASAGRISELIQKIPARRARNAGHMREPGFVSKKVGQQMIAGRDTCWKPKKIEILTWKRPLKLHPDKAGQAKSDFHMYVDRLKGNKDMLTVDVAEAKPHIKLVGETVANAKASWKIVTMEKAKKPWPEALSMKKAKQPLPKPLSMKNKQLEPTKILEREYCIAAKAMPAACNPPFFRQHVRQEAFCLPCEAGIPDRAGQCQKESSEAEMGD